MTNPVLVTGGAGYIGSNTVDQLISAGLSVCILDNFSTGHRQLVHPDAKLIDGDVRNTTLVEQILSQEKIDSVIHFAAFSSVANSVSDPLNFYNNNFQGTLSLLQAIKNLGSGSLVKSFIFSSTAAIYADPGKLLVNENSKIAPQTPYGGSKWMSERALVDFGAVNSLRFMILRYFNVAGASASNRWGQLENRSAALIKRAAMAAAGKISQLEVFGTDYPTKDGTAVRDFIHVEDLAELHIKALDQLKQGAESQILNCGYGHGFSVREVINMMKKVTGSQFQVIEKPRRSGDLAQVVADCSKLQKLWSWHPKRDDLELICRSAYNWEKKV